MNKYLKIAVVIVVLLGLGFFIRATDWAGVVASVQKVGFNFLILLFITFVSAWLGVVGWRYCMPKNAGQVSGGKLFWIRLIGENFAILNPTSVVGGEAMKIYMLRDLGMDQRQALHSILLSRAIMVVSQILMMLMAGIWFLSITVHDYSSPDAHWLWLLGLPILITGALTLSRNRGIRDRFKAIFHRIGILERFLKTRDFIAELWQELRTAFRENRRAMLLSFFACCLHWIAGSLEFYFILLFLGVKTTVAKALLVDMGVIVFKSAGAFVPGQIGIEEYGNKVMLTVIGIAGETIWITVSILRRSRQLFWIIIGLLMYFVYFHRRPAILQS